MSIESVRKRLDRYFEYAAFAAGRIVVGPKRGERLRQGYHDFSAHAPTDLSLALDVIEAAKAVADHYDRGGEYPSALRRFDAALDAFEAAP